MAIRTTIPDVRDILPDDVPSTARLLPFIQAASGLVDWLVSADTLGMLNANLQELIERWLAAHFYTAADQQYAQKMTGRASGQFQGQTAMMFMSSKYGQNACTLDITCRLAQLGEDVRLGRRRVANMDWLGSNPNTQANHYPADSNLAQDISDSL